MIKAGVDRCMLSEKENHYVRCSRSGACNTVYPIACPEHLVAGAEWNRDKSSHSEPAYLLTGLIYSANE